MRRAVWLAIPALLGSMLAVQPARAHTNLNVAGFQYTWEELPGLGLAGYLSTPAGPVPTGSTPSTDVLETAFNRDQVPHTITACVSACATPTPVLAPGVFNVVLPPGGRADLSSLGLGTLFWGCLNYTWMRGTFTVTGE